VLIIAYNITTTTTITSIVYSEPATSDIATVFYDYYSCQLCCCSSIKQMSSFDMSSSFHR